MAALGETETYELEIYQLEITDPVVGGPDGIDNLQAKQLANRTKWLKAKIDAFISGTLEVAKAAKLSTARTINGVSFDGSANIEVIAAATHAATSKTTPVDADELVIADSAAAFGLKKLTWANVKTTILSSFGVMINTATAKTTPVDADILIIGDSAASNASKKVTWVNVKATLKTYFDTLYRPIGTLLFSDMPAGSVIQVQNFTTGVYATGTALITEDNTIPQITEGTQFLSLAFTPKKANSKLRIDVSMAVSTGTATLRAIAALFKNTGPNAIATMNSAFGTSGYDSHISFTAFIDAIDTTLQTFTVRFGTNTAVAYYFNGSGGVGLHGGALSSSITITEIAQ